MVEMLRSLALIHPDALEVTVSLWSMRLARSGNICDDAEALLGDGGVVDTFEAQCVRAIAAFRLNVSKVLCRGVFRGRDCVMMSFCVLRPRVMMGVLTTKQDRADVSFFRSIATTSQHEYDLPLHVVRCGASLSQSTHSPPSARVGLAEALKIFHCPVSPCKSNTGRT